MSTLPTFFAPKPAAPDANGFVFSNPLNAAGRQVPGPNRDRQEAAA